MIYDPNDIGQQIQKLEEQIQKLEQHIQELLFLPVVNSNGEIVSYADLQT